MYPYMQVAINGYFWDRPRTGSGQYLRHLWAALNDPSSFPGVPEAIRDTYTMLLAPGYDRPSLPDDRVPIGPRSRVAQGRFLPIAGGKAANLDKLYWEEWSVAGI